MTAFHCSILFVFISHKTCNSRRFHETQDIAVDGWALTLLSPENVAYASTCQTVGTTLGYFTSFTIFLALNNGQFCDAYLRHSLPALFGAPGQQLPLVSLTG